MKYYDNKIKVAIKVLYSIIILTLLVIILVTVRKGARNAAYLHFRYEKMIDSLSFNDALLLKVNYISDDYSCNKNDLYIFSSAMARLETGHFKSILVKNHNYFGLKCFDKTKGEAYYTKEQVNGQEVLVRAKFHSFDSPSDCIDYYFALLNNKRYDRVREAKDLKGLCQSIYACGYATDSKYPDKLMSICDRIKKDVSFSIISIK